MTQDKAFLQAIFESPADDAPRLVYADWLDERAGPGDADRAEFIRVQIELARRRPADPQRPRLQERETALLLEHRSSWTRGLAAWARELAVFRRGFVAEVGCDLSRFLKGAGLLLRRAPVQKVTFHRGTGDQLVALAESPHLARLAALKLESPARFEPAGLAALVRSPHLARLTELDLYLDDDGVVGAALAEAEQLASLGRLFLRGGRGAEEAVAGSAHFAHLHALGVFGTGVRDAGAALLAAAPHLAGLVQLELYGCSLGPAGAAALARSPYLTGLSVLNLGYNLIRDEGAAALAAAPGLAGLTSLHLNNSGLGPAGVRALAGSPHLANLAYLYLNHNDLRPAGAQALADSPYLGRLERLYLDHGIGETSQRVLRERFGDRLSLTS
jgi:uncharacterized protein (TIGR02996 family)